jgi:WD40 repeat protein
MEQGVAAFAPDSRVVAVSREGIVHLYDLAALEKVETIPALGTNVQAVAYSPDGTLIVSGSTNGWLRLWSCAERRLLKEFPGLHGYVFWLRFSGDGTRLLSADHQGYGDELICWNSRTWQQIWSLAASNSSVVSVSPDDRLAVTLWERLGQLDWWNSANGKLLISTATPHRQAIGGVAFSPDGARAASVAQDGTVAVWDVSSFKPITTFKGHMQGAHSVAFSPDGRRLATGGSSRDSVKLWDLATYRELVTLSGQGNLFWFASFSPDGNWIAAGSFFEGQLNLWRAPSWEEIAAAEKRPEGKTQ